MITGFDQHSDFLPLHGFIGILKMKQPLFNPPVRSLTVMAPAPVSITFVV